MKKNIIAALAAVMAAVMLSSCAAFSNFGEEVNRAFKGAKGTITTYNQDGQIIDQISGTSLRVSRDDRFDTKNDKGESNQDSSVLLINVGNNTVSHVGSSLIMKDAAITDILTTSKVNVTDNERGVPFLNKMIEQHRNLWKGAAKTLMIRSQDGDPIAVFAGNSVEIFNTDVPKSTLFRVDGKALLVYRCDYTVYDTALLGK